MIISINKDEIISAVRTGSYLATKLKYNVDCSQHEKIMYNILGKIAEISFSKFSLNKGVLGHEKIHDTNNRENLDYDFILPDGRTVDIKHISVSHYNLAIPKKNFDRSPCDIYVLVEIKPYKTAHELLSNDSIPVIIQGYATKDQIKDTAIDKGMVYVIYKNELKNINNLI